MLKRVFELLRSTIETWSRCKASRMSAAMTYYSMVSLAPLLTFAVAIASFFFDSQAARDQIVEQVELYSSETVGEIVSGLLDNATRPNSGLIAGAISLLVLLYGASGVFSQLYDTFEEIGQTPVEERIGLKFTLKKRLLGILMVLIAGLLIVCSIVAGSTLQSISAKIAGAYPDSLYWLNLAEKSITWLGLPLILFLMFWLIPTQRLKWTDVVPAAFLTALLIALNRFVVVAYLRFSSTSEVYGAAGSLVVMLIWMYLTGLAVFFGAAFAQSWARTFGTLKN